MVKYVRFPIPNPKFESAQCEGKWILRNEPTLTLLLPTDANGHGKLRRQDRHVRRHGRWLGWHVWAVHEQRKLSSSSLCLSTRPSSNCKLPTRCATTPPSRPKAPKSPPSPSGSSCDKGCAKWAAPPTLRPKTSAWSALSSRAQSAVLRASGRKTICTMALRQGVSRAACWRRRRDRRLRLWDVRALRRSVRRLIITCGCQRMRRVGRLRRGWDGEKKGNLRSTFWG